MTDDNVKRASDEAVLAATGKRWSEWFEILDQAGASKLNHTRIAGYLRSQHEVKPWWSQMVANSYEKERGLRQDGQTTAADFQVGAQKTLLIKPVEAWDLLTSPQGVSKWLGSCENFELVQGFKYQTDEGVTGEVRGVNLFVSWRMSWKTQDEVKPSRLQVLVTPNGSSTRIGFYHEGLANSEAREKMRQRWKDVLAKLETLSAE